MADQNAPNDASRKTQAEGERWSPEGDMAGANQLGNDAGNDADDQAGGITNRPIEEEHASQDAVPDRGDTKHGAHAGHGETRDRGRSER